MQWCCKILLLFLVFCTNYSACANSDGRNRKGCAKAAIQTRSELPHPIKRRLHILSDEEVNKIKRAVSEDDDDDCDVNKRDVTVIKQSSIGSIRKFKKSKQEKLLESSSLRRAHPSALSHIVKSEVGSKRTVSKSPNLKTLKNSPLWSLSKLIDDVSIIAKKRSHKNASSEVSTVKETSSEYHPATSSGVTESQKHGANRSLEKEVDAIIDKKIAAKSDTSGTVREANKLLAAVSKTNKTLGAARTSVENNTASNASPSNATIATQNTKESKEKKVDDPYAEIAAGPDKPKVPQLRSENENAPASDSPLMKLGSKGVEQVAAAQYANSKSSLSGQHDVGGLLDTLTDKLNAGGGGVATDQPLSQSDLSQVQSQLAQSEAPPIAASPMQDSPAEGEAALPPPATTDKSLDGAIGLPQAETGAAKMEAPQTDEAASLEKDAMDNLSASDYALSKGISDKAGSLSKLGAMSLFKDTKSGSEDDGGADISPGPDPYTFPGSEVEKGTSTGTELESPAMEPSEEPSDMLNGGSITGQGLEREGASESLSQPENEGYDQSDAGNPFERASDIAGETRSTRDDDQYLNTDMGTTSEDGAYNTRHNIPAVMWDRASGVDNTDSFTNSYNTQMFKKNVILRPKKDTYVSPFSGKESFENDM